MIWLYILHDTVTGQTLLGARTESGFHLLLLCPNSTLQGHFVNPEEVERFIPLLFHEEYFMGPLFGAVLSALKSSLQGKGGQ